jgi:UDP-3-O-[3-hydroxymyristoyl] glucosamine N-acyltransferase
MNFTAKIIAEFLQGTIEGNPDAEVNNISKIEDGKPGTLSFLANPKYEKYIYDSQASIILVNKDFKAERPINATLVRVANAYESFASLLELYQQAKPQKQGISKISSIHESVKIGENIYVGEYSVIEAGVKIGNNVKIYPQVYIGEGVEIGDDSVLYAGVKVYDGCKIGKNCVLHSGVIIGADGFGFAPQENNVFKKIPQIGIVILEDQVEIGANSCVDRATMGATILRKGVKLDNLIQIAHNVEVGENTVMAAQTGIAGSTKIGKNCMFAAQVGIVGHLQIGDNVKIGGQSGIMKNAKDGEILQGSSAMPYKDFWKSYAVFMKLPEVWRQVNQLEREIKNINKK